MTAAEIVAGVLATAAGLTAIAVDQLSSDAAAREAPLVAGIAAGVTVGFAVLLFAGAIPRAKARTAGANGAAETAFVTSVVGFLSVASAWTGLPFVLGAGGAMLGAVARRRAARGRQRGLALLAVALGVLAVALGFVTLAVL